MHEAGLHAETEMRGLRASVDEAQHALASERAAAALRLSEVQREVSHLRQEMDRRQTEAVRREVVLQKSRDELASTAAHNEREASALIAAAREEESARVRRLEAERSRLNEQLLQAESDSAASAAAQRGRADALQGEVAALKAELHGASLERHAATDDAERLRRRTDDAPAFEARFTPGAPNEPPAPGSLARFLVERYYMYVERGGVLFRGLVEHAPYPLSEVEVHECTDALVEAAGLPAVEGAPIAHFSPGVDTQVYDLTPG